MKPVWKIILIVLAVILIAGGLGLIYIKRVSGPAEPSEPVIAPEDSLATMPKENVFPENKNEPKEENNVQWSDKDLTDELNLIDGLGE
ncbi:MAG: hypothetical protein WC565_00145 [Parcubacteria group bacterium]